MNNEHLEAMKPLIIDIELNNKNQVCVPSVDSVFYNLYNAYIQLKKDYDDLKIDYNLLIKENFNKLEEENND